MDSIEYVVRVVDSHGRSGAVMTLTDEREACEYARLLLSRSGADATVTITLAWDLTD